MTLLVTHGITFSQFSILNNRDLKAKKKRNHAEPTGKKRKGAFPPFQAEEERTGEQNNIAENRALSTLLHFTNRLSRVHMDDIFTTQTVPHNKPDFVKRSV